MPIPTKTRDEIIRRALAYIRTSFPGLPLGVKRFLGRSARGFGLIIWGIQKSIELLDLDIVPSPQSSTDALSDWAATIGLPDGEGGFGRLKSTAATGGAALLTGVKATVFPTDYPAGTTQGIAVAEDGTTQIQLAGAVIVPGVPPGSGSIAAQFVAVTKGTLGNLPAGTVCTWQSTPSGADTSFTLTSALTNGKDQESNSEVYARIVDRLQNPPRGGTSADYRLWETEDGAAHVYVYPKRSGTGTVDSVIVADGNGQGRKTTTALANSISAALDQQRPAAVDSTNVYPPYMPDTNGHVLRVNVQTALSKYAFDWDDRTGGPFTVDTYTPGVAPLLKLNTLAPASLKNAIDAAIAAGTAQTTGPRLQVLSTPSPANPIGSQAVNISVRAVAWVDGGGKTTLTLQTLPQGWIPPLVGDTVYAYGPVVATIAAGLLSLVDSLGPSRMSGFGDPFVVWRDKLEIDQMIRVAENAIDTDGTELIDQVPIGGATIDGVAADVQAADNTVNPPELLYADHIAVTQA